MNKTTSRAREAEARDVARAPRRFVAWCAVALTLIATVGATVDTAPAESDTAPRYARMWENFGDGNKRWARRTSRCESGGDARIHGGGGTYHGAFQFMRSTWRNAPKSPGGDPHRYSWKTQAVVAVYLKKRDGARAHWPGCG
jgi:hypothetical protein